jgi:hypothetical protein
MQNQKSKVLDYVACPLYKREVSMGDCIDLQEVAGGLIKPRVLPDEILKIPEYKEVCNACPNNFENYDEDQS